MCSHYPTPSLVHLSKGDYDRVYEPSEDSFLFLDALEKDIDCLKELNPEICIEVGCGSGVVTTFLASILQDSTCFYLGIDVNLFATKATIETFKTNNIFFADAICDDLTLSASSRLKGKVDVILFNPPYVPTPSDEVGGSDITAAWAGGKDGREVINRFLPQISALLSDNGVFYLLLMKENNPDEICELLQTQGLVSKVILTRRTGPENLMVIRFSRK